MLQRLGPSPLLPHLFRYYIARTSNGSTRSATRQQEKVHRQDGLVVCDVSLSPVALLDARTTLQSREEKLFLRGSKGFWGLDMAMMDGGFCLVHNTEPCC